MIKIGSRFTMNAESRVLFSRGWNPALSIRNFSRPSISLSSNENGILLPFSTRIPVMVQSAEELGGGYSM